VPLNWSAYEDIAEFFTNDGGGRRSTGKPIYGHMTMARRIRPLGWRFTDAWLSMAGSADKRYTNGMPLTSGASVYAGWLQPAGVRPVSRGGAVIRGCCLCSDQVCRWMKKYAPKEATGMTFGESGPVPAQANCSADLWYTAFTESMVKLGLPVVNADGTPESGAWLLARTVRTGRKACRMAIRSRFLGPSSRIMIRRKFAAAWLYAQFGHEQEVSLKKSIVGTVFIRDTTSVRLLYAECTQVWWSDRVYRSPARVAWSRPK